MKKFYPLVSIVIPLYNAENFIKETLLSVSVQTYLNYEVIIVDNASTDSSLKVVNQLATMFTRLSVIRCDNNSGGPARPRNIGMRAAKGDYIAFLDSDDIWHPEKLEKQVEVMSKLDWDIVASQMTLIDECGKKFKSRFSIVESLISAKKDECNISDLMFRNNIITSSVLVRRSAIKTAKFDESDVFRCVEDYLFWLEVLSNNSEKYFIIPKSLVNYRVVDSSLSSKDGKFLMLAKSILVNYFAYIKFKVPYKMFRATIFNLLRIIRVGLL